MMIIASRNRHDCDHEIIVVRKKDTISANDLMIRWSLGGYDLYMEILKGNLRPLKGVKEPRQSTDDGILYFCIDLSLPPDPRSQEDTIGVRKTPQNRLDRIFNRALGFGPDFSNVFFYIIEIEEHEDSNHFLKLPVVKETNKENIQVGYKNKLHDTSIGGKGYADDNQNLCEYPSFIAQEKSNLVTDVCHWVEINIIFVGEFAIEIHYKGSVLNKTFDEMGFSDGRRKEEPNSLWSLFKVFAENRGEISPNTDISKQISNLRKQLKTVFPHITGDPIRRDKMRQAYTTVFTISSRIPRE